MITVAVTMTLEIDEDVYAETYGLEGVAEIRADVKSYVPQLVDAWLLENALGTWKP